MGVNINDNGTVKSLTAKLSGFTINGIDQIADHHTVSDQSTGSSATRFYSIVDIEKDYDYYFVKVDSGMRSSKTSTPAIQPPDQSGAGGYRSSNIGLFTRDECKITKITVNANTGKPSGFNPDPFSSSVSLNHAVGLILDEVQFPNKLILYGGGTYWEGSSSYTYDPIPGVSIWGIY